MKPKLNNVAHVWNADQYCPTDEEVTEALEQAEEMMLNMRLYGTIDKPKSAQAEDQSAST